MEAKTVARKGFSRITFFKKSGARLYIPEKIVKSPEFPFADGEVIKIEVGNSSLRLGAVDWWEMLDWKTMPETYEKLPEDIKTKIEKAGLI
jgi:hypothetical protein